MPRSITTRELRDLIADSSPQLVEVLPRAAYEREHLPGATNIPLEEMTERTVEQLDRDRPVVSYCFDTQCDLSARAAERLESLGFADVYDYTASKAAWLAEGLPATGSTSPSSRAGAIARKVPTCGIDVTTSEIADRFDESGLVVVVTDDDVVLGAVRHEATGLPPDTMVSAAMQPAPPTVRPSILAPELAKSMEKDDRTFVLVTTLRGELIGIVEWDDLHGVH